ncbi:MAG: hypothetical protein COY80_02455 [Candidatus Pacebacteria bacterium CG_4_10_14_0_8_um_filter_42_14]|nr:MAG: hypothetical protein COY80_02455 [Candidatus Pacebacteria bacterium CG_4_10_14_0_8_um_filter_42_14]
MSWRYLERRRNTYPDEIIKEKLRTLGVENYNSLHLEDQKKVQTHILGYLFKEGEFSLDSLASMLGLNLDTLANIIRDVKDFFVYYIKEEDIWIPIAKDTQLTDESRLQRIKKDDREYYG